MAFCAQCGAEASGSFCPKCGGAISGGPAPAASPSASSSSSSAGGLTDNVAAALCYALGFVTGIIFLVLAPYNQSKNVRFHAFQSIFLSAAWFVINFVVGILMLSIGFSFMLSQLISLAMIGLWLFLLWKTYNNEKVVLPVIGQIAEKQA